MSNTNQTDENEPEGSHDCSEGASTDKEEQKLEPNAAASEGSLLQLMTNGMLSRVEVVGYIFAFLSLLSLHVVFFALQIGTSLSNFVDAVFFANAAFQFTMLLVVLFFSYRFGPIVIELFLGAAIYIPIKLWIFFKGFYFIFLKNEGYDEFKHARRELLFMEAIEKEIDSAEKFPYYCYQVAITILVTWLTYLNIGAIIEALVISAVTTLLCLIAVVRRFKQVSWVRRLDNISVWYGRETPGSIPLAYLYSKDKKLWETLFSAYVFLSVFASVTGVYRYSYLLSLPPVQAKLPTSEKIIGNYIGTTSDGILLRDCKSDLITFLSLSGLTIVTNGDILESDDLICGD